MVRTHRRGPFACLASPAVAPYPDLSPIRALIPARRPLFDKSLHTFKRGSVHHVACHDLACRAVRVRDTQFGLPIKKFFSHRDGDAWFADDRSDESLELSVELFGFCD